MSSIFLSHAHTDKPFARRLATDLRLAGHAVWIDEAEINIGDSLIEKIHDGLDQVDYVAAILSSASIASHWVTKELDIASNREIKENRTIVLPLMVEKVDLPGFLVGKFYGDFTDLTLYQETLSLLLRKLGPSLSVVQPEPNELAFLKEQLAAAQATAAQYESVLMAHQTLALRGKSPELVAAIKQANQTHPSHAPINATYAFEVGHTPMTLGYLLWCIGKAERRGGHPIEILITLEQKWEKVNAMLQAYSDLLNAQ